MAKVFDVLGVGCSAVDDLIYLDAYPDTNVKVPVRRTARFGGGLTATALAAAARLGASAAYVGRFDEGELSRFMRGLLETYGVDAGHVVSDGLGQPYHSYVVVDQATGSRTVFYDCRSFRPVGPEDLAEGLIRSAKVFVLDFLAEPAPVELARKVHGLGVPIVGDMEGRSERVGELIPLIDYLVVSEEFAMWHTGLTDLGAACVELARCPRKATVVTAGARGCYWTDGPARPVVHTPAFVVETRDTNGCGDTYHGAFAFAIACGWTVGQAIELASACGALKAMGVGGWEGIPTREQVVGFLRARRQDRGGIETLCGLLGKVEKTG